MQVLIIGFVVSFVLWTILSFVTLQAALKLYRDAGLPAKWLLVVPFLLTSIVFFGIRYRFALWALDRQAIHELFSIGAYPRADFIMFVICLPLFYVISILRPEWVERAQVTVPLLVILPFVIKLVLYFSGLAPWALHDAQIMPTRME